MLGAAGCRGGQACNLHPATDSRTALRSRRLLARTWQPVQEQAFGRSEGPPYKYCESTWQTRRRPTRTVEIGPVKVGSEHKIALQTMTTTDTRDVEGTVDQVKRCADVGADIVRITVQGMQEAKACQKIRDRLFQDGYNTPLVADIHFNPKVALLVADAFEKVRINPGNFSDGRKTFEEMTYDDEASFRVGAEVMREKFTPLVEKCKKLNRAIRIGTNHGSLSARILSYYGDTPRGMVESAFEFAEMCRDVDYHNFLFSMKASNPLVMVQDMLSGTHIGGGQKHVWWQPKGDLAYRLLAEEMYKKDWDYPLHLGVTEAGEGEDGRMKSAIGIGALLMDGLGDTIRVSLTEDPELEIDPCRQLARWGERAATTGLGVPEFRETTRDTHDFGRREGRLPEQRPRDAEVDYRPLLHRDGSVLSAITPEHLKQPELMYRALGCKMAVGMPFKDLATSDSLFLRDIPAADDVEARRTLRRLAEVGVHVISPIDALEATPLDGAVAAIALRDAQAAADSDSPHGGSPALPEGTTRFAITVEGDESEEELLKLKDLDTTMVLLRTAPGVSRIHASRRIFDVLKRHQLDVPVIHHQWFEGVPSTDEMVIATGTEIGGLLVDGLGDGVLIEFPQEDLSLLRVMSFGLLQGARMRNIKTEYVSCPSCGRTLFDLQEVTEDIRTRTGHLPGVSIAVMGCIVNGPGEMADADFGYVGGAPGKIDLYVNKDVVRRGIPMEGACDELIELIKQHDRWIEPPSEEEVEDAEERQHELTPAS